MPLKSMMVVLLAGAMLGAALNAAAQQAPTLDLQQVY